MRRRRLLGWLGAAVLLALAGVAGSWGPGERATRAAVLPAPSLRPARPAPLAPPSPLAVRPGLGPDRVKLRFKRPPRAGLLFDLDTGEVLWRHQPARVAPIASLTKMMTALVVVDRVRPGSSALITREALAYRGSAVGLLPRGRWVAVGALLHGLLLPSGNDAAIALAQRAAGGSVARFVTLMNDRARGLG